MRVSLKLSEDEIKKAIKTYIEAQGYMVRPLEYGDHKPDIALGHSEYDHSPGLFEYCARVEVEKI